ncbi:mitotic-spindle organizing gamma-tubulin ring associated-domain-containing protein [Radiomyces spectabilis]|uniref:mitotic-spindle organizing gamma-tubulin ring associated-domain-containing protein n=1 Tax=Radiomyces spectabilis TaxID=64574 RepID=UPI00221ECB1A|nr:mitotic-spindle organizing gamma-tubulin ring associated-domain-containing protein [Radiomyces spectabilis]KAI8384400.1 mitotic-spindle organizing gamma-tubulin ring associated-domain-containing protein [Radiomyces spectabilis]
MDRTPSTTDIKETLDIIYEMATILDTGLDRDTLALCVSLCEKGVNPEALATVIKDLREQQQKLSTSTN